MSKLIKLSDTHYIIVDDSKIKEGDWYCINSQGISCYDGHFTLGIDCKKITHSTQPLDKDIHGFGYWTKDIIPISLSEVEEAIYGYSVEKMAFEYYENLKKEYYSNNGQVARLPRSGKEFQAMGDGYIDGFNAYKELVKDKLFTELQLLVIRNKLVDMLPTGNVTTFDLIKAISEYTKWFDDYIQSLLPKTEWDVEFVDGKINQCSYRFESCPDCTT